jgi:peptidoglycan/xylan/chitin deacetylase (PgdA/CDA1 family)
MKRNRNFSRREILQIIGAGIVTRSLFPLPAFGRSDTPKIAITIDDPTTKEIPLLTAAERDGRILETLSYFGVKAALFVCGKRVDSPDGRELLERWDNAGHLICNHSYSHLYFHSPKIGMKEYADDFLKGEEIIKGYKNFTKLFRFPFLKEGDTAAKRDGMRRFLLEHEYKTGYVSLDGSDWYVDRMTAKLKENPKVDTSLYKDFYLHHIWSRAQYYDSLAKELTPYPTIHTILLHHTLLNALYLKDLMTMFKHNGWDIVNADKAFADPLYKNHPNVLPAGESILWSLAKESGKYETTLRYPGEDGEYEKAAMDKLGL